MICDPSHKMEHAKYKKYMKEDNYVQCTVCGNYRNINSFAHRKSEDHQKKLAVKLRKVAYHLSQKRKSLILIHDEYWPDKDHKRFCHFCGDTYSEHQTEDTFTIEFLGSLNHHSRPDHVEAVKTFLKRNFWKGAHEKFCVQKDCLDKFLAKIPDAKRQYMKKMDVLNDMIIKQIRNSEDERKRVVSNEQMNPDSSKTQSSLNCSSQNLASGDNIKSEGKKSHLCMSMLKNEKRENRDLVPPWLKDISSESSECGVSENQSGGPVYGPTIDTLMKHIENQKKKGLSKNRIGAGFKHHAKGTTKWLPSFQGVWNQGRRKQMKIQFNRKNKTY